MYDFIYALFAVLFLPLYVFAIKLVLELIGDVIDATWEFFRQILFMR